MPLALYQKAHLHIQGNLGFLKLTSRSFIKVLHFILRSVIHVNFCEGCNICVYIFLCVCRCLLVPASFVEKDFPCSLVLFLSICQRSVGYIYVSLFQCSLSFPLMNLSVLLPIPHCLDCCSSTVSLEVGSYASSNFVLFFQYCGDYSESFASPYKLWNQFFLYP